MTDIMQNVLVSEVCFGGLLIGGNVAVNQLKVVQPTRFDIRLVCASKYLVTYN
jgi:hypothetical protein